MAVEKTREPQYQVGIEIRQKFGPGVMGLMSHQEWHMDPKRLGIVLSRYKFVAKMFSGFSKVLEVGCADAFATRVVCQEVGAVVGVDFDPLFIEDAKKYMDEKWPIDCRLHDMLNDGPIAENFDGAYALDVLEHIEPTHERMFIANIVASLATNGVAIFGMPSLSSQRFASDASKLAHVNCKDVAELKELMQDYFHHVFMFCMNDEVLHTGFSGMAHYIFALCAGKK